MIYEVAVNVMPKAEISDPQGQTVEQALPSLGFNQISGVRIGKRITLKVEAPDPSEASQVASAACEQFLTNPIIEDYDLKVTEAR